MCVWGGHTLLSVRVSKEKFDDSEFINITCRVVPKSDVHHSDATNMSSKLLIY
jgi:hypothetical protein